jgi:hypothetical protein
VAFESDELQPRIRLEDVQLAVEERVGEPDVLVVDLRAGLPGDLVDREADQAGNDRGPGAFVLPGLAERCPNGQETSARTSSGTSKFV